MDYELLIVGSGPAGQQAAWQAARLGKRVAMVERKPSLGGAGLQTGTIPSKALREVAFFASRAGERGMRGAFGRAIANRHAMLGDAMRRKESVIAKQESVILKRLLGSGVALIPGDASFVDAHTVEIVDAKGGVRRITAEVIVLAAGSRPRRPESVPFDKQTVLDSTSVLKLRQLPASMLVVGGGVIACEFVSIFAAMGVEVTVVDSHAQLLDYLSDDVVGVLAEAFAGMGVRFHMQERVELIERLEDGGVRTTLKSGKRIETDVVLYAQGREPNTAALKPENAGIELDQGWIAVNGCFQTNVPHIYAVGDLIGRPALASTGMAQGDAAVLHAFTGETHATADNMPMAIYTIPELSWVGTTEKELRRQGKQPGVDYVVGRGFFRESARGQIIGENSGMLKMIVDVRSEKLIGVHIVGESASELIHIGQLVMNLGGSVRDLVSNVFNYPTLAECYKLASYDCLERLPGNPT